MKTGLVLAALLIGSPMEAMPPQRASAVASHPLSRLPAVATKPGIPKLGKDVLDRIHRAENQIRGLSDNLIRIRGLGQIGALVCSADPEYGRRILADAYGILESQDWSRNDAALAHAAVGLISDASGCEKQLARQFSEGIAGLSGAKEGSAASAEGNASAAMRLLKNGDVAGALSFARSAASQPTVITDMYGTLQLLFAVRSKDPKTADSLFLAVLNQLDNSVESSPDTLLMLGSYLFTSQFALNLPPAQQNGVTHTSVGSTSVINISADRPGFVTSDLARTYLRVALDVLSRATLDAEQKVIGYAVAYELAQKAEEWAPDLAPYFQGMMQQFAGDITPQLAQSSVLALSKAEAPEQTEEEINSISDLKRRDEIRLRRTFSYWSRGDFREARQEAERIQDPIAQVQLLNLVTFGEAGKAIGQKDREVALAKLRNLAPGAESAVLWLGMAHLDGATGDKGGASQSLLNAEREAETLWPEVRPNLLLAVSSGFASLDAGTSVSVLWEAIQEFNRDNLPSDSMLNEARGKNAWRPPRQAIPKSGSAGSSRAGVTQPIVLYTRGGLVEIVEAGRAWCNFPLKVKGLDAFSFGDALPPIVSADPDGAEAAVRALADESKLTEGLTAFVGALLADRRRAAERVGRKEINHEPKD